MSDNLPFDKYELYNRAVQSADTDVKFLAEIYKKKRGKPAKVLREDFCGGGALSMEWVKLRPDHEAYGIDLDPEPLNYGREHYASKLKPDQKRRLHLIEKNVLDKDLPKADLSIAVNFSYFLFKSRARLKEYFENVHRHLNSKGVAVFDVFGGTQCTDEVEDLTKHKGFTYYWDQTGFDPVTNEAMFHIHFRVGKKKYLNVFSYDWRIWSIPELLDLLREVGFQKTHVYWEGTKKDGSGDGVFKSVTEGEACLSWIAYIVAER